VLDDGHEQVVTTFADGEPAEVVKMPHSSPWPVLLALCLSGMFAVLVVEKFAVAAVFAVLLALTLLGWHSTEPEAE
jgi:hypothetical protein